MSYVAHICDDLGEDSAEESGSAEHEPTSGDALEALPRSRVPNGGAAFAAKLTTTRASRASSARG